MTQVGLRALLNGLVDYAPDPAHHEAEWGRQVDAGPDSERISRKYNDSEPLSAYCFRTIADPFAGRINVIKIMSGHLGTDANALNSPCSMAAVGTNANLALGVWLVFVP